LDFDFPNSPINGQTVTSPGGALFTYDGVKWTSSSSGTFLPLSGGTMTGPLNVTATGGSTARSVQANFGDVANVLDYGADPTGGTDSSAAFNAAAATLAANNRNKAVYLPAGTYLLANQITLTGGQTLFGDGRGSTVLLVDQRFSTSATSVLMLYAGGLDPGPIVRDLGITFAQPQDQGSRANFRTLAAGGTSGAGGTGVMYPPAIAAGSDSTRIQIRAVRIGGAWDGITSNGHNVVMWIDDLEIGALHVGLSLGATGHILDFCHVNGFHFWNFDISSTLMSGVYLDGQTIALEIGQADGVNARDISTLAGRVVFDNVASPTIAHITNLMLDTDQATLEINSALHVNITNVYYSAGTVATKAAVTVAGGYVTISNWHSQSNSAYPAFHVSGGELLVQGGVGLHYQTSSSFALADANGMLFLRNLEILPAANAAWTQALVHQSGGTSGVNVDNLTIYNGGYTASGIAVQWDADQFRSQAGKVQLPSGWTVSTTGSVNTLPIFPAGARSATPTLNDSTTRLATTAYVIGQAATAAPVMDGAAAVGTGTTWARADHVHPTNTTRAPLASPNFTGTVQSSGPLALIGGASGNTDLTHGLQFTSSTTGITSSGTNVSIVSGGAVSFLSGSGGNYFGPGALAFFNTGGASQHTVTGSRAGNAALASLLTALASYGLVVDSTT
jgi:hypothetical protein